MPLGRWLHTATLLQGYSGEPLLAIFGGKDKNGTPLSDLYLLDITTLTWLQIQSTNATFQENRPDAGNN